MAECEKCRALSGVLSSVDPHPDLVITASLDLSSAIQGQTKREVVFYKCCVCRTRWGQDLDKYDQNAGWFRTEQT